MNHDTAAQTDELQRLLDGLATELGRSVVVDDPMIRLLAASRHFGDEDDMRIRAVMQREADPPAAQHLLSPGIRDWHEPGRVPGSAELNIKPRVCVPIRAHGLLLGFLWLIDESLRDWEIDRVRTVAEEAGLILYRRLALNERERGREEALLRDLVASDPVARARAREEISEAALLVSDRYAVVVAVEMVEPAEDREKAEVALRTAVEHAKRTEPAGTVLAMVQGRRALLLRVGHRLSDAAARSLGQRVLAELRGQSGVGRCVAGLGTVQSGADAAVVSHEQARAATRAAALLPSLGDLTTWKDLGVYALLIKIAPHELTSTLYPPAVLALVKRGDTDRLRETAETYLDYAGDARRTSEALHIHRSTLYYRIERIEQITGMDLRDGGHRLTLHLGIKLARLVHAKPRSEDSDQGS